MLASAASAALLWAGGIRSLLPYGTARKLMGLFGFEHDEYRCARINACSCSTCEPILMATSSTSRSPFADEGPPEDDVAKAGPPCAVGRKTKPAGSPISSPPLLWRRSIGNWSAFATPWYLGGEPPVVREEVAALLPAEFSRTHRAVPPSIPTG